MTKMSPFIKLPGTPIGNIIQVTERVLLTSLLITLLLSESAMATVVLSTDYNMSVNNEITNTKVVSRDCESNDWYTFDHTATGETGNVFNSANEIALLQGGNPVSYGDFKDENGLVKFSDCEVQFREKIIKIPVFLVDWADFDPAVDLSNPNNPNSVEGITYKKITAGEVEQYLSGTSSPAQYFKDVSGGRINIQFEVYGWLKSSDEGSHIKNHADYIYQSDYDGRWYCDRGKVLKDVLKESILNHGFNPEDYDMNHGMREHNEGLLNGAVLIYEGGPGSCSGTNMSFVSIGSYDPGDGREEAGIDLFKLNKLTSNVPTEQSILDSYNINLRVYNNLPESSIYSDDLFDWVHELGHMYLGYSDYYDLKYNMGYFALSAQSSTNQPIQPAGIEKWLLAKWIEPEFITEAKNYAIFSHDIADGEDYDDSKVYLYRYNIDGDAGHFLLIENRWLRDAGNVGSNWVGKANENIVESGIQIFEVNLRHDFFSEQPTILRLTDVQGNALSAWKKGSKFEKCYIIKCIRISDFSSAQQDMTFKFDAYIDSDADGVADEDDTFPLDPTETMDTDGDGLGNNVDIDDDGDGVSDVSDAFPLDITETVDTDGDGIGNNSDSDDDGDGVSDVSDAFPLDASKSVKAASANNAESSGGGSVGVLLFLLGIFIFWRKFMMLKNLNLTYGRQ